MDDHFRLALLQAVDALEIGIAQIVRRLDTMAGMLDRPPLIVVLPARDVTPEETTRLVERLQEEIDRVYMRRRGSKPKEPVSGKRDDNAASPSATKGGGAHTGSAG